MAKAGRSRLLMIRAFLVAARSAVRPGSPGLGARFAAVPRLMRSTLLGEYRGMSRGRLALMAGALVYLLSPIDLIPEAFLPLIGLADDAVVLAWLAAALVTETDTFLQWERTRQSVPSWVVPDAGTSSHGRTTGAAGGGRVPPTGGGASASGTWQQHPVYAVSPVHPGEPRAGSPR